MSFCLAKTDSEEDDFDLTTSSRVEGSLVQALEQGDLLTSEHIAAATSLLRMEHPEHAGFQSTLYVASGKGKPDGEGAINIHFEMERQHWVTSTSVNAKVVYFDSLYSGNISDSIIEQVKTIYTSVRPIHVICVQQQQGVKDCGLFTIAYTVHLAHNKDPSKIKFSQARMRAHFLACLLKKKLEFFPVDKDIPYTREHNDRSFYLKLVAAMGRYIYGVYLFMG